MQKQTSKIYVAIATVALATTTAFAWVMRSLPGQASAPSDAYADAVTQSSGIIGVGNLNNALGAPDNKTTGGVGQSITLDMGEGEEGTGSLRVYYGNILVKTSVRVTFLDSNSQEITSQTGDISVSLGTYAETYAFDYATYKKAYRYVRLTNVAGVVFSLDAVAAQTYGNIPVEEEVLPTPNPTPTPTPTSTPTPEPAPTPTPNPTTPPVTQNPPTDTCTNDTWVCNEWSMCSADGRETRTCHVTVDCPTVATPSPTLVRNCRVVQADAPSTGDDTEDDDNSGAQNTTTQLTSLPTSGDDDGQAPAITNIDTHTVNATTEAVTWKTDENSNGQVEYAIGDGPAMLSPIDNSMGTNHEIRLAGLQSDTQYTYRVYARDAAGNLAVSPEQTFNTPKKLNVGNWTPSWLKDMLANWGACCWFSLLLLILLIASLWNNYSLRRQLAKPEQKTAKRTRNQ